MSSLTHKEYNDYIDTVGKTYGELIRLSKVCILFNVKQLEKCAKNMGLFPNLSEFTVPSDVEQMTEHSEFSCYYHNIVKSIEKYSSFYPDFDSSKSVSSEKLLKTPENLFKVHNQTNLDLVEKQKILQSIPPLCVAYNSIKFIDYLIRHIGKPIIYEDVAKFLEDSLNFNFIGIIDTNYYELSSKYGNEIFHFLQKTRRLLSDSTYKKPHDVYSLKLRGNHHIIQVVLLSGDLKVIDMFFKALTKNKYYYKYFKSQYSTNICIQRIVAHFIRHNLTTFVNFIRRSLNPEDPEIESFTNEKFVEMQSIFFETLKIVQHYFPTINIFKKLEWKWLTKRSRRRLFANIYGLETCVYPETQLMEEYDNLDDKSKQIKIQCNHPDYDDNEMLQYLQGKMLTEFKKTTDQVKGQRLLEQFKCRYDNRVLMLRKYTEQKLGKFLPTEIIEIIMKYYFQKSNYNPYFYEKCMNPTFYKEPYYVSHEPKLKHNVEFENKHPNRSILPLYDSEYGVYTTLVFKHKYFSDMCFRDLHSSSCPYDN